MGKRGPKPRFLDVACPNKQCTLYGVAGKGNVTCCGSYMNQSGRVRKYICHECNTMFCDRTNTAFYDLRTDEKTVKLALKMAMRGMSNEGIAETLEVQPSTVNTWISRGAEHSKKVNEVVLRDVETSKVEMDELWTFVGKKSCLKEMNSKTKEPGSG